VAHETKASSDAQEFRYAAEGGTFNLPETDIKHVCILAEFSPTWLAVAERWKTSLVEVYSEKGEDNEWFTDEPRLKLKVLPTLVGVRNGRWKSDNNSLVLIQGSPMFCKIASTLHPKFIK
jgi:hypothetical protein